MLYSVQLILHLRPFISFSFVRHFLQIRNNFDIVHLHAPHPLAYICLFFLPKNTKLIIHWHSDIVSYKFLRYFVKPLEIFVALRAHLIIGATENHITCSYLFYLFRNKYSVQNFPVDFSYLNQCPVKPDILGSQKEKTKFIFSLGRHVKYKGFNVLIEAARSLPDDYIIIIGGDGPELNKHKLLVSELGLTSKVLLTGRLHLSEIIYLYQNCQFFVLPSINKAEMLGVVQLESMYFRKPVISTNIPGSGVSLINVDNYTGYVIKPNCLKSLEIAINKMITKNFDHFIDNTQKHLLNYDYDSSIINLHKSYQYVLKTQSFISSK